VSFLSTLKTFYFYCLLSSYYPLLHTILHHPTQQHFKFILGSGNPLFSFFLIPTVMDQVPKPFTTPTQLSSFSLKFFSQFSEGSFSLSKLLINKLYCCKNIVLCPCKGTKIILIFANYNYVCWSTRSLPS